MSAALTRTAFRTSRLLEFCSRKKLTAQTGHQPTAWPLVIVKELVDNACDACEEARAAPVISITVDEAGITVADRLEEDPELSWNAAMHNIVTDDLDDGETKP